MRLLRLMNRIMVTIAVIVCVSCERAEESSHEEVHWSYTGEGAPTHWADLRPDFALCGDGTSQSPVDLGDAVPGDSVSVTRDYRPATLRIAHQEHIVDVIDNGHTIQITYDEGSTLDLGEGIVYELAQYHFHSPSEHTVNGEHYPMEMHFVHQSADDRLAVVAAFIAEGAHNPAFGPIWENLPSVPGEERHLEHVSVDIDDLVPMEHHYYRYQGSLTTPPCSEGVEWIVRANPIELAREQIETFRAIFHENNRPVQPLEGRSVALVTDDE